MKRDGSEKKDEKTKRDVKREISEDGESVTAFFKED